MPRTPSLNPIIIKELRSRMRGARAFAMLTVMLLLLAAASYLLYVLMQATTPYPSQALSPQIGQSLFAGLIMLVLLIICVIAPAVTAGAISSERENQTYEMLMATPLSPTSILLGKLLSALSYVVLLVFAAIPMASLVFVFGGVTLRDMARALLVLLVVAGTLGVLGIFMSSWLGRTVRATVLSYVVVLALVLAPAVVYILVAIARRDTPPAWILAPNPVSALASTLVAGVPRSGAFDLLYGLTMLLSGSLGRDPFSSAGSSARPLYHYSLVFYTGLALVLYLLSTQLIKPTRRWRVGRRGALAAVGLLALFGGTSALAFGLSAHRYTSPGEQQAPWAAPAIPAPVVVERVVVEVEEAMPVSPLPGLSPIPTPTPAAIPTSLPSTDLAGIYGAVVRQLYEIDRDTELGDLLTVYLMPVIDDREESSPGIYVESLPDSTKLAVTYALSDLPAAFIWIDAAEQVPRDAGGRLGTSEALFLLGRVHPNNDDSIQVEAGIHVGGLAVSKRYRLEAIDENWQVMDSADAGWDELGWVLEWSGSRVVE